MSLLAVTILVTGWPTPSAAAADDELLDPPIVLAELGYTNGVHATFSRDSQSGDFGLDQLGPMDRSGPVVREPDSGLLVAYLAATPRWVPVPSLLLQERPNDPTPPEMAYRTVTTAPVKVEGLTAPVSAQASRTCWDLYWNSYNWYDIAGYPEPNSQFWDERAYYSSNFGGMKEFSDSYVAACGDPVHHRIYYKSGGNYHKQFDHTVPNGFWQAVHRGSVLRYRKVLYDAAFGVTRNGRFHN